MNRNWRSKKDRRDAAVAFLKKTVTDPEVRSVVLKDRGAARRMFREIGGINIPSDVEVICLGPSTQELDRLVVFALPSEDASTDHIDPLKHWIAAWEPYGLDPAEMGLPAEKKESPQGALN